MAEPGFVFEREVGLFLATSRTATVGTVSGDGVPHAANVQYVSDEAFRLLWVSSPSSRHSRDLAANPRVAVTVYGHDDRASNIHGVQMHGAAEGIEGGGDEWHAAFEAYTAKFTFAASVPQFRSAIEKQAFYRFTPAWVRWLDNRRGFGWTGEKALG